MRHVLSRRDKKNSPSIIPFSMRNKHENKPTMTLKKTNTYDNMQNNRLKLKRMASLILANKSFCNTVCVYSHANKAICCYWTQRKSRTRQLFTQGKALTIIELICEGVNGVNRPATKGEKILLTTDKTRKKLPTSDKKIN